MKAAIIYASVHQGNTKKVAEAIARELDAELLTPAQANTEQLEKCDLLGFGSGIYMWKHHKELLGLVNGLQNLRGKSVFIFSTSGQGGTGQHGEMRKALEAKGARVVGEFGCRGLDKFGPLALFGGMNKGKPDGQDLKDAAVFALGLKKAT